MSVRVRTARPVALLALFLLLGSFVVLPTANAGPITVRLFPNIDNVAPAQWQEPCAGDSNQVYFEEVNDFPSDLGAGGCIQTDVDTNSDDFRLGFENLPSTARSVSSVTLVVVAFRTLPGINGFDIDTPCANYGLASEQWAHLLDVTDGVYTTYVVADFAQGDYRGCRDDLNRFFPWTVEMLNAVQVTGTCDVNLGGHCEVSSINLVVTYIDGGGSGDDDGDEGGVGPGVPPGWNVRYPGIPNNCREVTIEDQRPEAVLAVLYVWSFGDGQVTTTSRGFVTHAYDEDGLYSVVVRVQYSTGSIDSFVVKVNARGSECIFSEFLNDFGPILLSLIALMLAASVIVMSVRRIPKDSKRLLLRVFLGVAIAATAVLLAVLGYAHWANIPI